MIFGTTLLSSFSMSAISTRTTHRHREAVVALNIYNPGLDRLRATFFWPFNGSRPMLWKSLINTYIYWPAPLSSQRSVSCTLKIRHRCRRLYAVKERTAQYARQMDFKCTARYKRKRAAQRWLALVGEQWVNRCNLELLADNFGQPCGHALLIRSDSRSTASLRLITRF